MTQQKSSKDEEVLERQRDEVFYETAMNEVNSGYRRNGLWVKAVVESGGDETLAKINYIRHVVIALKDEEYIAQREKNAANSSSRAQGGTNSSPQFSQNELDLMAKYGVQYLSTNKYFSYKEYHYDKLGEAIAHARQDERDGHR